MSDKSTGSTLAALALAGVMALTPGAATAQDSTTNKASPQTTTQPVSNQQQQAALRYMDVTARNDGWVFAQNLAIVGSGDKRIVIVSYTDPQTTRAFYDLAVQFTQSPNNLPIFGVVRAPQHPKEPNQNGFDVYFNGVPFDKLDNPDNTYSKPQLVAEIFKSIKRNAFASLTDNSTLDGARLAQNTTTGKSSATGSASGTGSAGSGGEGSGGKSGTGGAEVAVVSLNPGM